VSVYVNLSMWPTSKANFGLRLGRPSSNSKLQLWLFVNFCFLNKPGVARLLRAWGLESSAPAGQCGSSLHFLSVSMASPLLVLVSHGTWSLRPFRIKASRCRSALAMTLDSQTSQALGSLDSRCQLVFTQARLVATSVAKPSTKNQIHKEPGESW